MDSTNRNFIEKRLGLKIRNCPDGKEYLEIIDKVKEYINNKFSTMLEFSYEAWKSRKNYDTKYWVYAPGENASLWKECIKNDIMVLGWDKIGNYNQYKDIDAVYEAIKKEYKTDNPKNDKLAVWNFKNDMSDGDVVIAKNGIYKVLGYGIVESDYYYDDSRKFYKNVRKVHWIKTGEWKLTDKDPLWSLPQKTLTEFTYYEKDIEKIMNLMEEDIQMENRKYFWLNANPKIWSFSELKVGDTINYTVINKNGNKRRIYKNFVEAKKGDLVIAYESYPTKKVVGLCEIDNELKDNELSIRKIEDLINPVEYNEIKNIKELENMEYFKSQQGSLFKLTKEEYDILMDLIRDNNPIEEIFNKNKKEYSKEKFLEKVYVKEEDYNELTELLLRKKNIILQGAPGVGKTFMAKRLAYSIIGYKDDTKIKFIQFHQSYSYEDFIEGWRPSEDGFKIEEGVFYKFCKEARRDSDNKYFFIIDEINRGNLSKIFFFFLMLIEDDKREKKVTLAYSGKPFSVPENLYIIGMMNTADRSLAMMDYALRRRFSFYEINPAFDNEKFKEYQNNFKSEYFNEIIDKIKRLNKEIEKDISLGKGFQIGHSYFCKLKKADKEEINSIIKYEIIPMLEEYWFDDLDRVENWKNKLLGE